MSDNNKRDDEHNDTASSTSSSSETADAQEKKEDKTPLVESEPQPANTAPKPPRSVDPYSPYSYHPLGDIIGEKCVRGGPESPELGRYVRQGEGRYRWDADGSPGGVEYNFADA